MQYFRNSSKSAHILNEETQLSLCGFPLDVDEDGKWLITDSAGPCICPFCLKEAPEVKTENEMCEICWDGYVKWAGEKNGWRYGSSDCGCIEYVHELYPTVEAIEACMAEFEGRDNVFNIKSPKPHDDLRLL